MEFDIIKKKAINQIADGILKDVTKADEELKTFVNEFNEVKSNVVAYERKETGSLLVKPLGPYVKESDMTETEHLTTLMVVVPKVKEQEFLSSYELLEDYAAEKELEKQKEREQRKKEKEAKAIALAASREEKKEKEKEEKKEKEKEEKKEEKKDEKKEDKKEENKEENKDDDKEDDDKGNKEEKKSNLPECRNVVPRSAKRLYDPSKMSQKEDDDEFVLYRIIVMKKGSDSYKNLCRDKRFTVRPFKYDPAEDQSQKDKKKALDKQKAKLWAHIIRWAKTTYSDVFAAWIHIKAMRLFVESVLRYGLPVNFSATIIKPKKGYDKKLRVLLNDLYQRLSGDSSHSSNDQSSDASEADISGVGADFYPYVYLPVTLQETA